jgi:hypothetical protein
MKKLTLQLALMLYTLSLFAQWVPVNNGLPDYPPTDLVSWVDTMVVSTYGGGIYLTYDHGENWVEMPGTLPNLFVNDIRYFGGQFDPINVSTDEGPYICVNGGYIDCNGTGMTNNSINFFSGGNEGITGDYVVGTKGNGIFAAEYTTPFIYDWSLANTGITGDGLFVNDAVIGGEFAYIATEGGMYDAMGDANEWTWVSTGLSGDALKVKQICFMGMGTIIATQGGLYYTLDMEDTWLPIIAEEKFNVVIYFNTPVSPSGYMCYAFGETGYYTQDFVEWVQLDLSGMEGEVTAAQADAGNLYIGFTIDKKGAKESGGLYRRPLEQFIVGIEDIASTQIKTQLQQNYPNPFCGITKINYSLETSGFVSLKVYDIFGRKVKTLVNEIQTNGTHIIPFDASSLDKGTYFYSLQVGNNAIETKRMVLVH